MSIIIQKKCNKYQLIVAQKPNNVNSTDNIELCKYENAMLKKITNENRKIEFLFSRYLLKNKLNINSSILYCNTGKPFLKNSDFSISISHSYDYIALLVSQKQHVGIDIQIEIKKILKINSKFINQNEKKYFDVQNIKQNLVIWSAKEAMYKWNSNRNIDFKKDMEIKPFELKQKGKIIGLLKQKYEIKMKYMFLKNYVLVYTI